MKVMKFCSLAVAVIIIASGCLTSEEPFYQESDIKADDRLLGAYRNGNEQTGFKIDKDPDHSNRYLVTLASDVKPCTMRFSGVLFHVGTNLFFDMLPMLESCDHVAGSTPGPIETIQGMMLQPLHLVVKIDLTPNGLRYGVIDQQGLLTMARKFPEYFQARTEQSLRMVPDTKRQREFLLRFGGDTNIFKPAEIKRQAR
jgi:hypothetical protein